MADKNRRQYFLKLTRPQLIALATQKGVAPYRDAIDKTKGQLVALLCDVEGVLTPVKTWPEIDGEARLDNDPRAVEALATAYVAAGVLLG
jgi:hypothetical protein